MSMINVAYFCIFFVKLCSKYLNKEPVTSKTDCNISVNINSSRCYFFNVDSYNCLGAGYEVRLLISLFEDLDL